MAADDDQAEPAPEQESAPAVPAQVEYDRAALLQALATLRSQVAQETILWNLARNVGGLNEHPKQIAPRILLMRKHEAVMLALI